MHQNRRRKKRSSYGVRTVEISRGKNGFGFTISGQAPCILSCIVNGSPAEKAGLRPGDYLIAVNGQNVSKALHDDVVRLIGTSTGVLKLQIAENYYSDSSEDEIITVNRPKPKSANRIRHKQQQQQQHVYRAEKVVQDLHAGLLFQHQHPPKVWTAEGTMRSNTHDYKNILDAQLIAHSDWTPRGVVQQQPQQQQPQPQHLFKERPRTPMHNIQSSSPVLQPKNRHHTKKRERKVSKTTNHNDVISAPGKENCHSVFNEQELNNILYPSLQQIQGQWDIEVEDALYRAVVGYLGTIEMPKEPQVPGNRLQVIRNCIRRLRIEKKVHTIVLLTVFPNKVTLTNPHALTLAEYPAEKITFSGVYADDKKFFGLVTAQGLSSDELSEGSQDEVLTPSSSCHVFMVDPKMVLHEVHLNRAKTFGIECTPNPNANECREFPESADPILHALLGLYRGRAGINIDAAPGLVDVEAHVSPQHSNTSSNSSNSDSGIGFRDEGHQSDRVFVVDLENDLNYHIPNPERVGVSVSVSAPNLSTPDKSLPTVNNNNTGANQSNKWDRLTVRVMPDPVGFQRPHSNKENIKEDFNGDWSSFQKYLSGKSESFLSNSKQILESNGNLGKAIVISPLSVKALSSTNHSVGMSVNNLGKIEYIDLQTYKLSPKVYGVEVPGKYVNIVSAGSLVSNLKDLTQELEPTLDDLRTSPDNFTETTENTGEQEGSQDVHPPTQDEDSEYSELENGEHGVEMGRKWIRTSSLRQQFRKHLSSHLNTESGALSDGELASVKIPSSGSMLGLEHTSDVGSTQGSISNTERAIDVSRVTSWAVSFEKLLEDHAGICTFADFLKKEFSHENIYFWVVCERYRKFATEEERKSKAQEIFQRHLCIGAPEPVNVDSHARQMAQEGLENPTHDLFSQAQKQIFNLMKFDCYSRFLKSSLYKDCLVKDMAGELLPYFCDDLDPDLPFDSDKRKSKKGKEDFEERRRKSVLPWNRTKSIKNKDGSKIFSDKNNEFRKSGRKKDKEKRESSLSRSEASGSRSSLASSDLATMQRQAASRESLSGDNNSSSSKSKEGCMLCRVILPDCSTTVVQTKAGETIYTMLQQLLEKRGLHYSAMDVFPANSEKSLDQNADSSILGCREVRVEQRVLFRLDLPNKKIIGVKAKPSKLIAEVLRPILHKYGYKIDLMVVHLAGSNKPVDINTSVTTLDNQRLIVQTKEDYSEWGIDTSTSLGSNMLLRRPRYTGLLDELTNRMFEDLLKGKSEGQFDELGVLDFDKRSNKTDDKASTDSCSSGILSLVRRNSIHFDRDVGKRVKSKNCQGSRASMHESANSRVQLAGLEKPPIPRRAPPNRCDSEELFEVWRRAQRSRLDDQRGTEINFELPDFLKPKSGEDEPKGGKSSKSHDMRASEPVCSKRDLLLDSRWSDVDKLSNNYNTDFHLNECFRYCDQSFSGDSILPTQQQAEEYFSALYNDDFGNSQLSDGHAFRDVGFPYHSHTDSELQLSMMIQPPVRPVSHSRLLPLLCNHPSKETSKPSSPNINLNETLIGSVHNLDLDLDVTLKHNCTDDSLSPSKIPPPLDTANTSLHADEANYPPPSPISDIGSLCEQGLIPPPPQIPIRHPSDPPPPLPPKPKIVTPRCVSHQLTTGSLLCHILDGKRNSGDDIKMTPVNITLLERSLSPIQFVKCELLNQKGRSRKAMYVEKDKMDRFNISFV